MRVCIFETEGIKQGLVLVLPPMFRINTEISPFASQEMLQVGLIAAVSKAQCKVECTGLESEFRSKFTAHLHEFLSKRQILRKLC